MHQLRHLILVFMALCLVIGCPSEPDPEPQKPKPPITNNNIVTDAGATTTTETQDASLPLPPTTDAGTTNPPETQDAGTTSAPETQDAGTTTTPEIQDAGTATTPERQDAGTAATPEIQDAGLTQPVLDSGVSTLIDSGHMDSSSTDAGPDVVPLPTTNDVYRGLHPHCYQCHTGGAKNYFADIDDDSNFTNTLVEDPFFVLPGFPESSELYLLLLAQGDDVGAVQMPPYGDSFAELSTSGQTELLIEDVYDWILFMEDVEISDGGISPDSGWIEEPWDAGHEDSPDAGEEVFDAGTSSTSASISVDFSDVVLATAPDSNIPDNIIIEIEADGIMTHDVRVTVRSTHNLPIPNAEVRIVNFLNNMTVENCGAVNPGTTNSQGQITCHISSEEANSFVFDVQAKSSEEDGWVLLYDNLSIAFVECQNARNFYIKEIMGPVFTTCIGCHNEYGLAKEWPWSHTQQSAPDLNWPWQGKIEGETGFIDFNLEQLSNLVETYGSSGGFSAPGYDEGVPYILAKPAGLIDPTNADDPSLPFGHGGGKVLEPGSDSFDTFWELLKRVDDDKECPTDSESLFHDPYAGGAEYSATELYHRASFTLTGQFPTPDDYLSIINDDDFNEDDFLDKLSEDVRDTTTEFSSSNGNGLGSGLGSGSASGNELNNNANNSNTDSIMYQEAFYQRMGEALDDLLLIRDHTSDVDTLFSIDNQAFQRRMTFRHRYDQDLTSSSGFSCLPEQDFENDSTCNPNQAGLPDYYNGEGLSDEDCMIKRGCCEDIGNSEAWNSHIPPLDPNTQTGPQCGQYANTINAQEDTCNQAAGCHVKKHFDSFADVSYDIYAPDGSLIDRDDPNAVLTLQWVPQDGSDSDYGYCYTIKSGNTDKERCWHDSDMSWADARGFRTGGPESDIVIPNMAFFYRYPKRLITNTSGLVRAEVFTNGARNKLIMPWDCRHDFCTNGYEWSNEDLGNQTSKLMEYVLRNPDDSDFNNDFRNVITTPFYVLNPYAAFIFGQNPNDGTFSNALERNEWRKIEDIKADGNMVEHLDVRFYAIADGDDPNNINRIFERPSVSGWLTMPTFLNRYPSTATNLNRMRSNEVHNKFLAVDIMSLVSFTVDPNQPLPDNATLQGFSCRVCHAAMDPLGGHFLNYTRNQPTYYDSSHGSIGRIMDDRPDTSENECANKKEEEECVRTPGYKGSLLSEELMHEALPSLGQQIANDDRFSLAVVRWLHESLLGLIPLKPPKDKFNPYYSEMVDAYLAQHHEIERVRTIFVESGYNLRAAIAAILNGRIYRIKKAKFSNEYQKRVYDFAGVGAGQRLIPEQLNRKIYDTLGYPWLKKAEDIEDIETDVELLDNHDWYKLMYGGIDNRDVIKRDRDPSPISAAIARRMAVQMACLVVPQEFSYLDPAERRLFRFVDIETTTDSDQGAIEEQIQWLFLALYGEYLPLNDTEITAAMNLFEEIQSGFTAYDECQSNITMLFSAYYTTNKPALESCLTDNGYAGNYSGAPLATVNLCLASIDESLSVSAGAAAPYDDALIAILAFILESYGYTAPDDLDENVFIEFLTQELASQCGQFGNEGKALPTKCSATEDFYSEESLDDLSNRRAIRSADDTLYTIRAWQVLMTAMLSDYKYLYE